METLAPATNVSLGIATAMSRDMTMLVPVKQVLDLDEVGPRGLSGVLDRLRRAGVAHVACLEPIENAALRPRTSVAPARIAPLEIHLSDLLGALPLRAVAHEVRPAADATSAEQVAAEDGFQAAGGVAVEAATAASGANGSVVSTGKRRIASSSPPRPIVPRCSWFAMPSPPAGPRRSTARRHRCYAPMADTAPFPSRLGTAASCSAIDRLVSGALWAFLFCAWPWSRGSFVAR